MFSFCYLYSARYSNDANGETIVLCEELNEMKNVKMVVDKDNILTIKVDLNEDYGESKSGKSIVIATTEGNVALDSELSNIKIGLNVYRQLYSGRDWQPTD
jgi:hypothetical protein